jgi:hypothetical protein
MNRYNNPKWWTSDHDSAWERTKLALRRDWDQTVHDVTGKKPDTDQDVGDTLKQAAGKQPIPPPGQPTVEDPESAHRFGFGARMHYGKQYQNWDSTLEERLKADWHSTYPTRAQQWETDKRAIRYGWDYGNR